VSAVVTNYLADRSAGESFADWAGRTDEDLLRGDKVLDATLAGGGAS
jgi:sulfite reductase (ferredoxin)